MNCHWARDLLSPYVDGELPAGERAQLEQHLEQCEDCRSELAELQALVDALGSLPEEPLPSGFGEQLHSRLTRRSCWSRLASLLPSLPVPSVVYGRAVRSHHPGWARALAVACLLVFLASSLTAVVGLGRSWWAPVARESFRLWGFTSGDGVNPDGALGKGAVGTGGDQVLTGGEVASTDRTAGLGVLTGPAVAPNVRPWLSAGGSDVTAGVALGSGAALQGELELQVVDIDRAVASLTALAERVGGYLQDSTVTTQAGKRQAVVVVRVPRKELSGAMEEARDLGRALGQRVTTRSLTQDWVDAEARLRIMRAQEKTLEDLMSNARNIDEVLRIQYELYRLQGDIESLQARMEYLREDLDKATLQVVLHEVGMVATLSPWQKAGVAFVGTVRAMERLGQEAIVYVAQAFPVLMLAGLAWLVYARFGPGRWRR